MKQASKEQVLSNLSKEAISFIRAMEKACTSYAKDKDEDQVITSKHRIRSVSVNGMEWRR